MAQTAERRTHLLTLSPRDLLKNIEQTGEKVPRVERVFLGDIVEEATRIDESHALDLADEILGGGWNQTQTFEVRARLGGKSMNTVVYDMIDGFHRQAGLKARIPDWHERQYKVNCIVLYGCSDEELIEKRILAANSVRSVKFSRIGLWMNEAWKYTPWKDKLTLTQAVGLANNDSSGKILRLSPEEAEEVKEWARRKAKKWLMDLGTLCQNLRTIEYAAPELVSRVRMGSFGRGQLALTPTQLESIAGAYQLQYDIQIEVANYANSHSLSTFDIGDLLMHLRLRNAKDLESVQQVLSEGTWKPPSKNKLTAQIQPAEQNRVIGVPELIVALSALQTKTAKATLPEELRLNVISKLAAIKSDLGLPEIGKSQAQVIKLQSMPPAKVGAQILYDWNVAAKTAPNKDALSNDKPELLQTASETSRLKRRLKKFAKRQRPWYVSLQELGRPVTAKDIEQAATEAYESFLEDVFERVVQLYLLGQKREGNLWTGMSYSSRAQYWNDTAYFYDHFAEFWLDNGTFRFHYPAALEYTEKDKQVEVRGITEAKVNPRINDVDEIISHIGNSVRELTLLNKVPWGIASTIFGCGVKKIHVSVEREDRIFVPQDCLLNHPLIQKVPMSLSQIEQAVVDLFNASLSSPR